jgi:chaperonin GroEL (HSP60 family)
MEIDRGYISPQFVNNPERLLVEYDNIRVLVTDQKIESIRDIVPLLEQVTRLNSPLLIVAEDVTGVCVGGEGRGRCVFLGGGGAGGRVVKYRRSAYLGAALGRDGGVVWDRGRQRCVSGLKDPL